MRISRKLAIYANRVVPVNYEWLATYSSEEAVRYQFIAPYTAQYLFYVIGPGGDGGTSGRPFIAADQLAYQATAGSGGAGGSGGYAIHHASLQQGEVAEITIGGRGQDVMLSVAGQTVRAAAGSNGGDGSDASAVAGGVAGSGGVGGSSAGGSVENRTGITGNNGSDGVRQQGGSPITGARGGDAGPSAMKYLSLLGRGGAGGTYPDNSLTTGQDALYTNEGANTSLGGGGGGGGSHASFISENHNIPDPPPPPAPPPNPNVNLTVINELAADISIPAEIEDYQLNYGRIMLPDETILPPPPADLTFIAWQQEGSGEYYSAGEYLSLTDFTSAVTIKAIWGSRVFVGGDGYDEHDGLTPDTRIRTMGRAFEVLARLYSGNPDANINGLGVTGDAAAGYQFFDDPDNWITMFHGQIIVCSELSYHNQKEGRYQLITFEKVRQLGMGTVAYDDHTGAALTFTGVTDNLGYDPQDPVRVTYQSAGRYLLREKDYSGTAFFMFEKVLNQYQYEFGRQMHYGYGRLTQYSQSLRRHTSAAVQTPRNDGIVMITSAADSFSFQNNLNFLTFADYTRYAADGPLIFKNINLRFYHDKSVETATYVAGLAACGYYLGVDQGIDVMTTANTDPVYYIPVNLYGGGFSYRYNGSRYFGSTGNQLGDAGQGSYQKSRITIKSGSWSTCYAGNYNLIMGRDPTVYGYLEDNAGVINIYGGSMVSVGGAGHESSASAVNTYVYIYDTDSQFTVYGSGSGSRGQIILNGRSNILIHRSNGSPTLTAVYGGSGNGPHLGDTNIVFIDGTAVDVFGGSREADIDGNTNILVFGGVIGRIIGGGRTGSVTGKVTINIFDGIVNDSIYSSSAGSTVETRQVFYGGAEPDGSLTAQITDPNDPRLKILMRIGDNPLSYPEVVQSLIEPGAYGNLYSEGYQTQYHSDHTYELSGDFYYLPHVFNRDFTSIINGYRHTTYSNHGALQYTITRYHSRLNLAFVGDAELNISGGIVYGDVYGGGEVALVRGDTMVRIVGGVIHGRIFGGGNGAVTPTVNIYTERGFFSGNSGIVETQIFQWAGEEEFDIDPGDYSSTASPPIDYDKHVIYSPNYRSMGSVYGNTVVLISEDAMIKGEVSGDGNESNVFGTKTVVINQVVAGGAGRGGSGAPGGVVIEIESI